MTHLGRERMEASTWRPSYGPHRPLLRSEKRLVPALWFVVLGALLVAFTLTSGALIRMNETYPPVIKTNAGFTWTALDPETGQPVSRAQWIEEATR